MLHFFYARNMMKLMSALIILPICSEDRTSEAKFIKDLGLMSWAYVRRPAPRIYVGRCHALTSTQQEEERWGASCACLDPLMRRSVLVTRVRL